MYQTLKLAIASVVLATALPTSVNAQSTSGNITGEAAAGDTITITSVATGIKRELKIDKDGKYQFRRLPTGEYHVARARKDGTIDPVQGVRVHPGGTARVLEPGRGQAKDVPGS